MLTSILNDEDIYILDIEQAHLSKVTDKGSHTHQRHSQPCKATGSPSRAVSVRCLAQWHPDTPARGSRGWIGLTTLQPLYLWAKPTLFARSFPLGYHLFVLVTCISAVTPTFPVWDKQSASSHLNPKSFPFLSPFPLVSRDDEGVQVFSMTDQRSVVLEITITNSPSDPQDPDEDGDDAHAAQLLISLPPTLSYMGSRIPAQVPPLQRHTHTHTDILRKAPRVTTSKLYNTRQ